MTDIEPGGDDAWARAADDPVADALIDARDAASRGDHLVARRAAAVALSKAGDGDDELRHEALELRRRLSFDPVALGVGLAVLALIVTVTAVTWSGHHADTSRQPDVSDPNAP